MLLIRSLFTFTQPYDFVRVPLKSSVRSKHYQKYNGNLYALFFISVTTNISYTKKHITHLKQNTLSAVKYRSLSRRPNPCTKCYLTSTQINRLKVLSK